LDNSTRSSIYCVKFEVIIGRVIVFSFLYLTSAFLFDIPIYTKDWIRFFILIFLSQLSFCMIFFITYFLFDFGTCILLIYYTWDLMSTYFIHLAWSFFVNIIARYTHVYTTFKIIYILEDLCYHRFWNYWNIWIILDMIFQF